MIERSVLALALALVVVAGVYTVRAWSGRRVAGLNAGQTKGLWNALGEAPDGRPSLVVFSTPSCTACRTAQHPAVEAVEARFGEALRVLKVDLSRRPAVGQAFKVMTAPSTVVLGGDGRVGSFNHGFAPADQLATQISAVAPRVSSR
ncbi:MAG TPA: thioredoxin family protein [Candidatus Acidoferrum sp.]|nr:thioredoxin family protein [Candidatus Acidoferrum sp.]